MKNTRIERDEHLIAAGECFMSLCWVESTMGDLIVLQDGDDDMRKRYNDAFGHENHPADFTRNRLNLGKLTFEKLKKNFFIDGQISEKIKPCTNPLRGRLYFEMDSVMQTFNLSGLIFCTHPISQPVRKSKNTQNVRSASTTVRSVNVKMTIYQTRGL